MHTCKFTTVQLMVTLSGAKHCCPLVQKLYCSAVRDRHMYISSMTDMFDSALQWM